jgi:CheY-like chemotaxis protein
LKPHVRDVEGGAIVSGIARSIKTMSSILDSLLDVTRLEAGIIAPALRVFPLSTVLQNLTADFAELAKEKGLEIRVVPCSVVVRSDQQLLEEMLRNLVSNAVRYTDQGKILIGSRRANDNVRIEVWDSGVGIPGQHIAHVFDEYYQVPQPADNGGVGLGLAIVHRLGKLLGHRIAVRSVVGKGSGFSIEVPMTREGVIAKDASKEVPDDADTQITGTILLIEDENDLRRSLARLLRTKGLSVLAAATANEALTLVKEEGVRPDLILSDYNLPGLNGVEGIQALRKALAWNVPAIVLTGDIRAHIADTIVSHDLIVVTKPLVADELFRLIHRHAGLSAQAPDNETPT